MNKYRAKKVQADGYTFDSKAEYKRYCELKVMERAGEIREIQVHPKFDLLIGNALVGTYKPDFRYLDLRQNRYIVEDVKGVMTRDASLRIRIYEAIYGYQVQIIGKAAKLRKFKRAA